MGRPKIVEQNYFEFKAALRKAVDEGNRLEPKEKERWRAWVKKHRIQEAAFRSLAEGRFEGIAPVIIDDDGPWGGYYLFSTAEEACLKWTRED
ncbi:MAG: hypothetical protein P8X53_05460 [Chromatiales bacterium]|jgi:hypothetical protein